MKSGVLVLFIVFGLISNAEAGKRHISRKEIESLARSSYTSGVVRQKNKKQRPRRVSRTPRYLLNEFDLKAASTTGKIRPKKIKIASKKRNDQEPNLFKKESEYLLSLGIPGQTGLYAGENIKSGQFIGWYEGKIYYSVRSLLNSVPSRAEMVGIVKEFSYFYDVMDPKTEEYLYSVDAYQPVPGKDSICNAAYVNHKPMDLGNAKFKNVFRPGAPMNLAPGIFAIRNIAMGEEITVDYGEAYENRLQERAPAYRRYLEENFPQYLMELHPTKNPKIRVSQLFELFPSLTAEVFGGMEQSQLSNRAFSKFIQKWKSLDSLLLEASQLETNSEEAGLKIERLQKLIESYELIQRSLNELRSDRTDEASILTYKNLQRLAFAQWRLSLVFFALEMRANDRAQQLEFLRSRLLYATKALENFEIATQIGVPVGIAFSELGRSLKAPGVAEKRLNIRALNEILTEDLADVYSQAELFRNEAETILLEDSSPLKAAENKLADRPVAISFYQYGLYLIENRAGDGGIEQLRGHFNWGLAEALDDDLLSDPEKAYPYALAALAHYQLAQQSAEIRGQYDEDVLQAQDTLRKIESHLH